MEIDIKRKQKERNLTEIFRDISLDNTHIISTLVDTLLGHYQMRMLR